MNPAEFGQDSFEGRLKSRLLTGNLVGEKDFNRVARIRAEQLEKEPLSLMLIRLGMISERVLAETVANLADLQLRKASEFPDTAIATESLSSRFLKDQLVIPIQSDADGVELAMADPCCDYAAEAIAMALGQPVRRSVAVGSEIAAAVDKLYNEPTTGESRRSDSDEFTERDVAQLRDMASEAPVIRLVNQIIQRAVDERASDIHIEPFENQLKIRQRIDGVLRNEYSPPMQMAPAIISRIKIMAELDIAERRLPQDGRINTRVQGKELDIRVSTVPTMYGESVVMRLLKRETVVLDFDSLGFSPELKRSMLQALDMPHGMVIVTGPTGSGKTTTLYTALNGLNTEQRKVITVEDPVEYNLEGINQIQVNPETGLSFSNALRSIMRQDPDVIMVGEMRDLETARICVQSALTGHLVLSTLHTNTAAGSITRLLEMGVEDYLLNSTLNTILAQRLVRLLCTECREPYATTPALWEELQLNRLQLDRPEQLYRAQGCEQCGGSGYRGRTALIELLTMTDSIRELILKHAGVGEIEQAARRGGMHTMYEQGCIKAIQGLTTIEEVVRVTQET